MPTSIPANQRPRPCPPSPVPMTSAPAAHDKPHMARRMPDRAADVPAVFRARHNDGRKRQFPASGGNRAQVVVTRDRGYRDGRRRRSAGRHPGHRQRRRRRRRRSHGAGMAAGRRRTVVPPCGLPDRYTAASSRQHHHCRSRGNGGNGSWTAMSDPSMPFGHGRPADPSDNGLLSGTSAVVQSFREPEASGRKTWSTASENRQSLWRPDPAARTGEGLNARRGPAVVSCLPWLYPKKGRQQAGEQVNCPTTGNVAAGQGMDGGGLRDRPAGVEYSTATGRR